MNYRIDRTIVISIVFSLCFILVDNVVASPSIKNVNGDLKDGGILTINGSGFGKHANYGGKDNFLPYLWENFDEADPYITNPKITSGYARLESNLNKRNSIFDIRHQRVATPIAYTTFRGEKVTLSTLYNCKIPVAGLSPRSEYFFSGWFMTQNIETLTDNVSNQLKTLDASPLSNNFKVYFNLEGYAGYPRYNTSIEANDTKPDVPINISAPDGTWHRFDIYMSVPVAANSYTDVVKFWIDGRLIREGKQIGNLWKNVSDFEPINAIYFVNWINNSSNSPFYILSDDHFIDFTQARVEISESSVWDETKQEHKELQIPVEWSDGVIKVTINQGSFTTLDGKYLFVIDKNNVPSPGFALSIQNAVTKPSKVEGFINVPSEIK